MDSDNIVVGLDIGTANVTAVIGEYDTDRNGEPVLKLVGYGNVPSEGIPSDGIHNGVIINTEAASACIVQAVEDAVNMSGRDVEEVVCGISGNHMKSFNLERSFSMYPKKPGEFTELDMHKLLKMAGVIPDDLNRSTVSVIPIKFIVDDRIEVKDPVGMKGNILALKAHVITASTSSVNNLKNCIERSEYSIQNMIPITLADCKSVLISEEEKAGVMIIDIGGGTTQVGVQMNRATYFTGVVPIGGKYVTNDIAAVLKLSGDIAEKIKVNRGVCHESLVDPKENIEISDASGMLGERSISRIKMCEIAKARMWEIFSKVKENVEKEGAMQYVNSGIVLTGGGALLPGAEEVAEEVFKIPVRLGNPIGFTVDIEKDGKKIDSEIFKNPKFAGAIGLAQLGLDIKIRSRMAKRKPDAGKNFHNDMPAEAGDGILKKARKMMWNFLKDF